MKYAQRLRNCGDADSTEKKCSQYRTLPVTANSLAEQKNSRTANKGNKSNTRKFLPTPQLGKLRRISHVSFC